MHVNNLHLFFNYYIFETKTSSKVIKVKSFKSIVCTLKSAERYDSICGSRRSSEMSDDGI